MCQLFLGLTFIVNIEKIEYEAKNAISIKNESMKQKMQSVNNKEKSKQQKKFEVVSFYKFIRFKRESLQHIRKTLLEKGEQLKVRGLILLSPEGINATVSGPVSQVSQYLQCIEETIGIKRLFYKRSFSEIYGFKKLRIKLKTEIINMGAKTPRNLVDEFAHLEPEEWEAMFCEKELTVLDIRNDYEVEIGKFKRAKTLALKEFREFPEKLKEVKELKKDNKTLIYCTGGIRCEKALVEMRKQGFKEVYQLKGGIINYLKEYPNKSFEGECFVFDHRVALDQNLKVSDRYELCPHCGQPADQDISCVHCSKPVKVCKKCLAQKKNYLKTCTKNCMYHFRAGHSCKKLTKQ